MNVATADTMIACWEAKYHYMFWRPNHAIQRADTDGNAATAPEATMATAGRRQPPGVPVRPRLLHRRGDRVAPELLRDETRQARDHEPGPGAGPPRTFENLDELVGDVENARVWGGLHYRTTMTETAKHFPRIARDIGKRHFLAGRLPDGGGGIIGG